MESRRARRSSILKTRNEGATEEVNYDNWDGTTRNLTGVINRRRVSFSQTNQVKEFEKSNSSTEGSLSGGTEFNQTMCGDMNMSCSVLDEHINSNEDKEVDNNKTSLAVGDMSIYHANGTVSRTEELVNSSGKRRVSFSHTNQVKEFEKSNSSTEGSLSGGTEFNQTMCTMDMSISLCEENRNSEEDNEVDKNKTSLAVGDMSIYHANGISDSERCPVGHSQSNQVKNFRKSTRSSLSSGLTSNRTLYDKNMSITMFEETRYGQDEDDVDKNKTRLEGGDMSVYHDHGNGDSDKRRVRHSQSNQVKEFDKFTKSSLSGNIASNQTIYDKNMSISVSEDDDVGGDESEKNNTGVAGRDMSIYHANGLLTCDDDVTVNASNKRRVSFSQSNQVKEFEKFTSKSCLSSGTVSNQTMFDKNMSMSISMFEKTHSGEEDGKVDKNKTRLEGGDMSVYHVNGDINYVEEINKVSDKSRASCSQTNAAKKFDKSTKGSSSSCTGYNQTMCDKNMSITMYEEDMDEEEDNSTDKNKTKLAAGDMSVYHASGVIGFDTLRVSDSQPNEMREFEKFTKNSLSRVMVSNQTMCDKNMSFTMFEETRNGEEDDKIDKNKTRLAGGDMSVYHADGINTCAEDMIDASGTDVKQMEKGTPKNLQRVVPEIMTETHGRTQLYFGPTDPQQFLDPFGQARPQLRAKKRGQTQPDSSAKLSFGKFGSAKTPKRNKIATDIVPKAAALKPPQIQKVSVREVEIQTSPMVYTVRQNLTETETSTKSLPALTKQVSKQTEANNKVMLQKEAKSVCENAAPIEPELNTSNKSVSHTESPPAPTKSQDVHQSSNGKKQELSAKIESFAVTENMLENDAKTTVVVTNSVTNEQILRKPQSISEEVAKATSRDATSSVASIQNILDESSLQKKWINESEAAPMEHTFNVVNKSVSILETPSFTPPAPPVVQPLRQSVSFSSNKQMLLTETGNFGETKTLMLESDPQSCLGVNKGSSESILQSSSICEGKAPENCLLESVSPSPIAMTPIPCESILQRESLCESIVQIDQTLNVVNKSASILEMTTAAFAPSTPPVMIHDNLHQPSPIRHPMLPSETGNFEVKKLELLVESNSKSLVGETSLNKDKILQTRSICEEKAKANARHTSTTFTSIQAALNESIVQKESLRESVMPMSPNECSPQQVDVVKKTENNVEAVSSTPQALPKQVKPISRKLKLPTTNDVSNSSQLEQQHDTQPSVVTSVIQKASTKSSRQQFQPTMDHTQSTKASPRPEFIELKNKIKTYAHSSDLNVFKKLGFLQKAIFELSLLTEYEWIEILKTEKVRDFFGETYIKAVNVQRELANDPIPSYRAIVRKGH